MNSLPIRLRFDLRVFDAGELVVEALAGVDLHEVQAEAIAEARADLQRLVLAQHAVVDEDRRELIADGLGHEQRRDGGVDAAADRGDRPCGRRPAARISSTLRRRKSPRSHDGLHSGDVEQEVADDLRPRLGVRHLGMELDAVAAPLRGSRTRRSARSARRRWCGSREALPGCGRRGSPTPAGAAACP